MKKSKKQNKTLKCIENQYWSTLMEVDDEIIDRINIWHFYYFVAATIVPLLEDFLDVTEFRPGNRKCIINYKRPEEYMSADDFSNMISAINLLIKYDSESGMVYEGRDINFERGDTILELTEALHLFVNLLPYLNDRHFPISEERYKDAPQGRNCDFIELCNLDKTIARRIFPTLEAFASMSMFVPKYFVRMFSSYPIPDSAKTEKYDFVKEWDKALEIMVESWRWILERKPSVSADGWEDVPENIYYGLHLFAEYLPEMQND